MTSTPLRQFFPTLGVVILLGFFLYNMTAPSPGTQGTAHAAPAAPTTDVPTVELEPEGKPTVSATRWSFGPSLNDSYSFSWK